MATFREAMQAKKKLVKKWKKMPGVIGIGYVNGKNKNDGACVRAGEDDCLRTMLLSSCSPP